MTQPEPTSPLYTTAFSEEVAQIVRQYSAEANAAYLLPYLRPGLRVLDFGCGPGSISVGLARAVEPGQLHGVDMAAHVEQARAFAEARGQQNAVFHVADLGALPFQHGFFDVVHCHNVLMYIPDPRLALAEIKRVLKPGGILGCRELICESCFTHPDLGVLNASWDMFASMVAFDNGHPQMGKDMKEHILAAGFENIKMSGSFDSYSSPTQIAFIHAFVSRWFLSPEVEELAVLYGVSNPGMWDRLRAAVDQWKESPEAITAFAYGEAIANKP